MIGSQASTKISKPPALLNFSGTDPVPKDEGLYAQWKFQVTGGLKVCTEEAVRSAIIRSMRGEVSEMISFIGFDGDLTDILEKVEKCFGKPTVWRSSPTGVLPAFPGKVREDPSVCWLP